MAAGLAPGGRIVTCEISARHAEFARRHIAASPYADRIEVRLGPAIETIATLDGPFDLVFIDADKAAYSTYFEAVLPKLSPHGLIAADNTLWGGRILDPTDESEDTVALRRFNDALAVDPRVVVSKPRFVTGSPSSGGPANPKQAPAGQLRVAELSHLVTALTPEGLSFTYGCRQAVSLFTHE